MRSLLLVAGLCALALLSRPALAQSSPGAEQSTSLSGSPSLRPVPAHEQLWRKAIWRAIDLREKQNQPLFAKGHQVTQIIIDAVKRGELQPYRTDSLRDPLPLAEFRQRLVIPGNDPTLSPDEQAAGFNTDLNSDDDWPTGPTAPGTGPRATPAPAASTTYEYFPQQLYQLELKEEMVFDKRRSRMTHKIKALSIVVPAAETPKGYDIPIGSFAYADLVRVFRAHPDVAIWFNPRNSAQHRNLADAFDLWLFASRITKVENPADHSLADLHGDGRRGLMATQDAATELIEFEDNLWSH